MKVHYSSEKHTWETPKDLFEKLDNIFNFTLDCCAEGSTAKCTAYYTKEDDALLQDWKGVVWCNPPYGRAIGKWIEKAHNEHLKGKTTVLLIPSRTDTKWFHDFCWAGKATRLEFIKGRIKFGGAENGAPYPSVLIFWGE